MKHLKLSSAILCGFKKVDGKQYFGDFCAGEPHKPSAVCVVGAVNLCLTGNARNQSEMPLEEFDKFEEAWGERAYKLNDEGMPWEHIYGMAKAAGL